MKHEVHNKVCYMYFYSLFQRILIYWILGMKIINELNKKGKYWVLRTGTAIQDDSKRGNTHRCNNLKNRVLAIDIYAEECIKVM